MSRKLMTDLIREVVRGLPVEEVRRIADSLPAQVIEGTFDFCEQSGLGLWIAVHMAEHNVSPAYELYAFIEESTLAAVKNKEAAASGDNKDETN
ncbi:hypothetical protein [Streptomyces sp. NPDC056401]|uniref:hypothetical protein n=1 Tax=Streptomyces sp. NPDC056401 TaxID=3345809 RepID=UPI0035E05E97